MTYAEALAYLFSLPRFADQGAAAYQPGLERMGALMAAMGDPHEAFKSAHIAGTNGKGSTASMLAAIATAGGLKVGLHTSPHLFHLTERLRIDGAPAPEAWLAAAVARYHAAMEAVRPSFFEATVALSLLYFAEAAVDLAVVEVGLGGRLDATNVLVPHLSIITGIGLDHTDLLGPTLVAIAGEKAGIIKQGVPVLTAASRPDVVEVLRQAAAARDAPFHRLQEEVTLEEAETHRGGSTLRVRTPLRHYSGLAVGLPGLHQQGNALLALRAAELLLPFMRHDPTAAYEGLRAVRRLSGLRGRLEILQENPLVVADVGHNPEGLATALAFVQTVRGGQHGRLWVLFNAMRDKAVPEMARLLAAARATVWPVPLASERALPVDVLTTMLNAEGVAVGEAGTVPEGLARFGRMARSEDVLLITGSHLVVAQLPQEMQPPADGLLS